MLTTANTGKVLVENMMIEMLQDIKTDLDWSSRSFTLGILVKRVGNNSPTKHLMRCIDWISMVLKKRINYI